MFFIAAGIYGFGAIVYIIFASGDVQPWASLGTESRDVELDVQAGEKLANGDAESEKMLDGQKV